MAQALGEGVKKTVVAVVSVVRVVAVVSIVRVVAVVSIVRVLV